MQNLVYANATTNYGVYTQVSGTSGTIYGYASNLSGSNRSNPGYGIINNLENAFVKNFKRYNQL